MCEISFMHSSADLTPRLYWRGALYEPGGGHPQLPRTPTNTPTSEPHARTEYTMNTQLLHLNKQNSAALKQHTSKAQLNTMCTFSGNHWFPFISVWYKNLLAHSWKSLRFCQTYIWLCPLGADRLQHIPTTMWSLTLQTWRVTAQASFKSADWFSSRNQWKPAAAWNHKQKKIPNYWKLIVML